MQKKILITISAVFVLLFTALTFWKYDQLLYNGLDLAIFTNVFWNTAHGDFFASSIQGGSYLGDHFAPLILFLAPLFRLWPDPRFLLLFQTVILALAAWPLYKIGTHIYQIEYGELATPRSRHSEASSEARRERTEQGNWCGQDGALCRHQRAPAPEATMRALRAERDATGSWLTLLPLAWLLNPFVHNAALFEFHMIAFAPFFLFWMYYFYLKRRLWPFLLFTVLALLVREDIAFLVIGFSLFTFLEWRMSKNARGGSLPAQAGTPSAIITYSLLPLLLALSSFTIAFTTISLFEPQGSYKFLLYYEWMRSADVLTIILHLFKPTNLAMVVGLLIPFLFTPLLRPRFLLLALFPFLQFALTEGGGGSVVLQTHYALLFLPALFLGTADVFHKAGKSGDSPSWLLSILLITTALYSTLTLGPLQATVSRILTQNQDNIKKEFLQRIPRDASVATTYAFLTPLSSRKTLASLHYAYLGKKQYATEDYTLPQNTEYLLIDFDDLLSYELQFPNLRTSAPHAKTGDDRLRALLEKREFTLIAAQDTIALFQKNAPSSLPPLVFRDPRPQENISEDILSIEQLQQDNDDLFITFAKGQQEHTIRDTLQLRLAMENTEGQQITRTLPIGWGILPPHEWSPGERVTMRYRPPTPIHSAVASLVRVTGGIEVDGIRSVVRHLENEEEFSTTR